jgi:hypothetical protein
MKNKVKLHVSNEKKSNEWKDINCSLKCWTFPSHIISLLPVIYMKSTIPVTNRKDVGLTVNKMWNTLISTAKRRKIKTIPKMRTAV